MTLFWNIVFIASIAQGFFLSLILLIQFVRSRVISQVILATLIFLFSYNLLNNLVYWNDLFETYPQFLFTAAGSRFLFAPLFFAYCLYFIDGRMPRRFLLHLIPFAIIFVMYLPFTFQSGAEKLIDAYTHESTVPIWMRSLSSTFFWLLSLQLIIYSLVILSRVNRALEQDRAGNDSGSTQLNWIKVFGFLFLVYGAMMMLYVTLILAGVEGNAKDYPISLVMCLAIYGISYLSVFNPELLKGRQILERVPSIKYAKSRLPPDYLERVASDFERTVDEQALHLDGNLRIDEVAKLIDVPKHHISQSLSVKMQKSFNEYLNERRVLHAQHLLDNMAQEDTIKTIMYNSGFNNRTSFNNNFKKVIGMTASEYVKSRVRVS